MFALFNLFWFYLSKIIYALKQELRCQINDKTKLLHSLCLLYSLLKESTQTRKRPWFLTVALLWTLQSLHEICS